MSSEYVPIKKANVAMVFVAVLFSIIIASAFIYLQTDSGAAWAQNFNDNYVGKASAITSDHISLKNDRLRPYSSFSDRLLEERVSALEERLDAADNPVAADQGSTSSTSKPNNTAPSNDTDDSNDDPS